MTWPQKGDRGYRIYSNKIVEAVCVNANGTWRVWEEEPKFPRTRIKTNGCGRYCPSPAEAVMSAMMPAILQETALSRVFYPNAERNVERIRDLILAYDRATDKSKISPPTRRSVSGEGIATAQTDLPWASPETAPKDGSEILMLYDQASTALVRNVWWSDEEEGWYFYRNSVAQVPVPDSWTPLGWVPLPPVNQFPEAFLF